MQILTGRLWNINKNGDNQVLGIRSNLMSAKSEHSVWIRTFRSIASCYAFTRPTCKESTECTALLYKARNTQFLSSPPARLRVWPFGSLLMTLAGKSLETFLYAQSSVANRSFQIVMKSSSLLLAPEAVFPEQSLSFQKILASLAIPRLRSLGLWPEIPDYLAFADFSCRTLLPF